MVFSLPVLLLVYLKTDYLKTAQALAHVAFQAELEFGRTVNSSF